MGRKGGQGRMDVSSLTISLPVAITLVGCFIGVMTYLGNKKRNQKKDTDDEVEKAQEQESRMVAMEKDIQYIRVMVDKIDKRYDNHETRIQKLERKSR